MSDHVCLSDRHGEGEGSEQAAQAEAVEHLLAIGYTRADALKWAMSVPLIARKARNWRQWLANLKAAGETVTNPPGLVRAHVSGKCKCVEPDCDEPFNSAAYRRRRERESALLSSLRDAATAAPVRSDPPSPGAAGCPGFPSRPELVPYLEQLRGAVEGSTAGFLLEASAVELCDGGRVLVLVVSSPTARDWLARKLPAVVATLPALFPEVRVEVARTGVHDVYPNRTPGASDDSGTGALDH